MVPQLLIRNVDAEVVERLKARAARHQRSLESELRALLTQAVGLDFAETRRLLKNRQKQFAGRPFPPSETLLARDRER